MATEEPSGRSAPAGAPGGEPGERPVGDVFTQFGQELNESLRREVGQLRDELAARAQSAAKGTGFLAAAGVAGAVAGAALLSLPLILARRVLPPGGTALLVAGAAGAAAVYLTKRGLEELGEAMPEEVDRLKEAAREAAARATGAVA